MKMKSLDTSMSTFVNTIHHLHLHLLVHKEIQGLMELMGPMSSNFLERFGIGMVLCDMSLIPCLAMYKSISWRVELLLMHRCKTKPITHSLRAEVRGPCRVGLGF